MIKRIFAQLDPRANRLPADTSRFVKVRPFTRPPFVEPDRFVQNNPAIQRLFAPLDPVNPQTIRSEARMRIQRMVDEANRMIANSVQFKGIRFAVHQESGRYVAVVQDKRTGEILQQIPTEQMLEMASRLKENSGLFKDITV